MTDFKVAIPDAVNGVQPLLRSLDDARRECQEAVRYVQSLEERLKQDREALHEAVATLEIQARESGEQVTAHVENATANFERVKDVVRIALDEWGQTFAHEGEVLLAAPEALDALAAGVKAMTDKVEAAAREILEWASSASQKLHDAVESVEHAVSVAIPALVGDCQRQAEAETDRVLDFLDKCEELIITKEAEWRDKMPLLHQMLEEAFGAITHHQDEVVSYAATQWEHLVQAQLDSTQVEVGKLVARLSSLGQAVANYEGQLEVAGQMVGERQEKAAEGAAQVRQELAQVRAHWETALGIPASTT